MSTLLRSAVIAGALAAPLASQAATPTLSDVLKASGVTESGYIDASFNYNNRQFNSGTFFSSGGNLAYGDGAVDGFTLNQVGLMLSSTPSSGFGGVVDILAGQDALSIPTDVLGNDVILKQAYAQYATGGLTVMGGRFVTLAGYEVIAATGNTNATRSLLFAYQPLTHTGVRAAYKFGDKLTVTGGLNNSALGTTYDNNEQKTIELQAALTPIDGLSVALTGYKGNEATTGTASQSPTLIDLVSSFQATKKLGLGLNIDHLSVDDGASTKVDGLALYGNLQVTDTLRGGARVEYVKTKDNTGTTRKQKELTLTGAVAAASNFDVVTDLRYDKDDPGTGSGTFFNGKDSMVTLVVSGIFKF